MALLTSNSSLRDYQDFVDEVYGPSNKRHFSVDEMLTNIERFSMRGLKGIRKDNKEKVKLNAIIAMSWFMSLMGQFDIDLEKSVWKRFSYMCSYCGECPCACKAKKVQKRVAAKIAENAGQAKPKTLKGFQTMFNEIYPAATRTLEHAGIHWVEEIGELSEAVLRFRGHHSEADFDQIILESSDLFSCFMGVFNSLGIDYQKELVSMFSNGCHVCKKTPCQCDYNFVLNFKS
jgi:NTP pyrophosphatase (non-canonical NTP hydrolase)